MLLTPTQARELVTMYGSPLYVYALSLIREHAQAVARLTLPYGLTVRYAMKANPHPEIIRVLAAEGLQFDASSSYEASELLALGIPGNTISLSSQQPAHRFVELLRAGVQYVATSMHQLALFAAAAPTQSAVGLRVNPGIGAGEHHRLTTGGRAASFGLWHEYLPQALDFAHRHDCIINRLHIHIGSGADPSVWGEVMDVALMLATRMPDVTVLDIGGGYKVAYMDGEQEANMQEIAAVFSEKLTVFASTTGRRLQLEMEPGRWLVAHSGCLLTEIVDIVDTGSDGFTFLRTNTGMNDFLRPALYGAQHEIQVLNDRPERIAYVVVGHTCETSDILTPAPHEPERLFPRLLSKARIGDLLMIADTGAYCAAMCAKGYNAFPQTPAVFV